MERETKITGYLKRDIIIKIKNYLQQFKGSFLTPFLYLAYTPLYMVILQAVAYGLINSIFPACRSTLLKLWEFPSQGRAGESGASDVGTVGSRDSRESVQLNHLHLYTYTHIHLYTYADIQKNNLIYIIRAGDN